MCSSSVCLEPNRSENDKVDVAIARKRRENGVKTNFVISSTKQHNS